MHRPAQPACPEPFEPFPFDRAETPKDVLKCASERASCHVGDRVFVGAMRADIAPVPSRSQCSSTSRWLSFIMSATVRRLSVLCLLRSWRCLFFFLSADQASPCPLPVLCSPACSLTQPQFPPGYAGQPLPSMGQHLQDLSAASAAEGGAPGDGAAQAPS